MSDNYDAALVHPAVNVTRELYESASASSESSSSSSSHRELRLHGKAAHAHHGKASASTSFSSTHRCELIFEDPTDDCGDGAVHTQRSACSDVDVSGAETPRQDGDALVFMATHLEDEARAQLFLTEEEQRGCLFRAFRALGTLIRIREADARDGTLSRPPPHNRSEADHFTQTSSTGAPQVDAARYLARLTAHARARRSTESETDPISSASRLQLSSSNSPPHATASSIASIPRERRCPPPSWRDSGARKESALRDALLTTLRELDGDGVRTQHTPRPGEAAVHALARPRPSSSRLLWSSLADGSETNDGTHVRTPASHVASGPVPHASTQLSPRLSPHSWRHPVWTPIDAEWNLSTNPHSLSAASRGLDLSNIGDAQTDASLLCVPEDGLYRDNAASRQRRASSAARLTTPKKQKKPHNGPKAGTKPGEVKDTSLRHVPSRLPLTAERGVLARPHQTRTRLAKPLTGVRLQGSKRLAAREEGARADLQKAYWEALNHLLRAFVVEGTAILRGQPHTSSPAHKPPYVTALSDGLSVTQPRDSTNVPTAPEQTYHCACLGATLSQHLTVVSVDGDCPHDVRVGDRVAAVEGVSLRELSDAATAEQVLSWDHTRDQYWTLIRNDQRRVVVCVTAPHTTSAA